MKGVIAICLLIFALVAMCPAQTATDQITQEPVNNNDQVQKITQDLAAPPGAPAYFAGAGLGFSRTSNPQTTGGLVFGMRPANTDNTWVVLKYNDITGETSTVSLNAMQYLAKSGNWGLLAIAGAGGATNDGNLLAMFSGGAGMSYSLGGIWKKLEGLSLSGTVEALKVTGSNPEINRVRLQFSGWLTKSF